MGNNSKIFEEDVMDDEFDDEIVYSYYDGIPEWIQNMSHEELVESLKKDIEQIPSPIRENLLELIEY